MLGLGSLLGELIDRAARKQADKQERAYWQRVNDGFAEDRRLRADDDTL